MIDLQTIARNGHVPTLTEVASLLARADHQSSVIYFIPALWFSFFPYQDDFHLTDLLPLVDMDWQQEFESLANYDPDSIENVTSMAINVDIDNEEIQVWAIYFNDTVRIR